MRIIAPLTLLLCLLLGACNSEIYTRDGVTDGDAFYLAPRAYQDDDPALQSWVAYSLMKSACQLDIGGDIPSRTSDYSCEFTARKHLVDTWRQQRREHGNARDRYLDDLLAVREAGYLDEYTVHYFGRRHWQVPVEVRVDDFRRWQRLHLRRHQPETRLIGSWGYRER
ncbi:MAG: hypothetical protein KJO46_01450 [Gammaproteobacteria bacterium]|nr:hypothetical protein [Gammaproteobacteria bacterium]